jgi:para-aminobenzoate synthetase component 1
MGAPDQPIAVMGGLVATELVDVSQDPSALDGGGRWVVSITFEGVATLAQFATWERRVPRAEEVGSWKGPNLDQWRSSLNEEQYCGAVACIREHIADGQVYQANICRTMQAPVGAGSDVVALLQLVQAGNPAPHSGALRLPEHGVHIASASPELYLRRDGDLIESRPIKGTARSPEELLAKDVAENVMIVDLVRNDLGRVCRTGSVTVPDLLTVERHPGLVHLVSTVAGQLLDGIGWAQMLEASFPPGSVTGAPKLAALELIRSVEAGPRGPYCGAFGWIDADTRRAELAVAIRTFWLERSDEGPAVAFGTGAGITWASDPGAEWRETQLKAERLLRVAAGQEVP